MPYAKAMTKKITTIEELADALGRKLSIRV
jgi:hypothetical protein